MAMTYAAKYVSFSFPEVAAYPYCLLFNNNKTKCDSGMACEFETKPDQNLFPALSEQNQIPSLFFCQATCVFFESSRCFIAWRRPYLEEMLVQFVAV